MLLNAAPSPGIQTAPATLMSAGREAPPLRPARAGSGATSNTVTSGTSVVADRHGGKAANGVEGGADRRPERKGGEHRHSDPGYDCFLRSPDRREPVPR